MNGFGRQHPPNDAVKPRPHGPFRSAATRSMMALNQAIPGIDRCLDGYVPSESPDRFRRHGTQGRQPDLTTDKAPGGIRQERVEPDGNRRTCQSNPVHGGGFDATDDRFGQHLGVCILIDGYLVNIGQLGEFLFE